MANRLFPGYIYIYWYICTHVHVHIYLALSVGTKGRIGELRNCSNTRLVVDLGVALPAQATNKTLRTSFQNRQIGPASATRSTQSTSGATDAEDQRSRQRAQVFIIIIHVSNLWPRGGEREDRSRFNWSSSKRRAREFRQKSEKKRKKRESKKKGLVVYLFLNGPCKAAQKPS